ncbi:MAG: 3-oxoacyl-[acyl-carrier-protein] synthase, partial [Acidimicrobiales bacterium]|nr:3-oxoacyl-[acyl-carrier-protein] synthase [Acidimicrobiales bacterium]
GDAAATFAAALAGRATAGPISLFPTDDQPVRFACEVRDFDPSPWVDARQARRIDRVSLLGIAAASDAMDQAGLASCADGGSTIDSARVAVIAGSGIGGLTTLEEQIATRLQRGSDRVSPFLVPMMMANATAGLLSLRYGFHGISLCVSTACASGANAIGEGLRMIRDGSADVVLAGGTEACITPTTMAAFARMGALSGRNDDPASASRPFDRDRDGFVMGEGAGFLVLESWDHAVERGATILGELAGYGRTCDAHHITAPDADGAAAVACMLQAIADAGLEPGAIGHVNAHGTSTPLNDAAETSALVKVFGDHGPPVTSTKGVTGHLVGAAGAVEAVVGLLSATAGKVPPVANLVDPDVTDAVDLVRDEPRSVAPAPFLSNSFGFGGHNASLVIAPAPAA